MKKKLRNVICLILSLTLLGSSGMAGSLMTGGTGGMDIVYAQKPHSILTADGVSVLVTDDPEKAALNTEDTDPNHKDRVTINTKTGKTTTRSGDTSSMEEVFSISKEKEDSLTSGSARENKDQITEFLNEEGLYNVDDSEKNTVSVTFPYVYKRVIVFGEEGSLDNTFGAVDACYYTLSGMYILDYESETAAMEACQALTEIYGRDHVMPDIPIRISAETFTETQASSDSWGNDMMHLDQIRDEFNAEPGITNTVTVAVLDTGIYESHNLFSGRIASGGTSFIREGRWGRTSVNDGEGHGTHVSGIIADGTPRQVQILPVKVMDRRGEGSFSALINGVNYALSQNADVINMSLGGSMSSYIPELWSDAEYLALEEAFRKAENAGCLCVTASGNEKADTDGTYVYPAISSYTITVSAIDQNKTFCSSYSNYGKSVDFAAPGDNIQSASIRGTDSYVAESGTSMAVPHISAACAVLSLCNINASNNEIINIMKAMAEDLGDAGKDKYYGNGLVVFARESLPDLIIQAYTQKRETKADNTDQPAQNEQTDTASSSDDTQKKTADTAIKKGKTYVVSGQTYKVTKVASAGNTGTAALTKGKNSKSVTVPASIKLSDGRKYKVTGINAKAFTGKKIRTVTLGSGVTSIGKNAFTGSRATKLILKTKHLTKASVKGSLKNSKIKSVQVRTGNSSANKKLVKKYKNYFTKKNAGLKVKVY